MGRMLRRLARTVEQTDALDAPADVLARAVAPVLDRPGVKDALAGRWLGHALHPALTDVTLGCLVGTVALDLVGGEAGRPGADRLAQLAFLSAVPTALSGAADWVDTTDADRRGGTAHAAINAVALGAVGLSVVARRAGARRTGVMLALTASGVGSLSAWLGGHLLMGRGVRVDRTAFEQPPQEWTRVASEAEVPEGTLQPGRAGDVPVLLYRRGGRVFAISDTCSHMGGPLHEGTLDAAELQVTCPWHASVFRLDDGEVVGGPAGAPQPVFEARIRDGAVEVRPRQAG